MGELGARLGMRGAACGRRGSAAPWCQGPDLGFGGAACLLRDDGSGCAGRLPLPLPWQPRPAGPAVPLSLPWGLAQPAHSSSRGPPQQGAFCSSFSP